MYWRFLVVQGSAAIVIGAKPLKMKESKKIAQCFACAENSGRGIQSFLKK